jgi:asparagine synthetase B (glutamine-hydrolysing)
VAISGDGADEIFAGYKDSRLFYLKSILPSLNFNNLKLLSLCFYLLNSKFSFIRKLTYFFLIFLGNDEILSMATYKGGWNLYYRKKYMTKEGFKITGKENVELNEKNSFKNSGKSILERYINYDLKRLAYDFLEKYNLQKIAKTPKQGFTPPLEKWIISEESKYFLNKIFKDKDSIVSKLFKLNKLKKMTKTDSSLIINKSRLWFLMILYIWHKENFLKD